MRHAAIWNAIDRWPFWYQNIALELLAGIWYDLLDEHEKEMT